MLVADAGRDAGRVLAVRRGGEAEGRQPGRRRGSAGHGGRAFARVTGTGLVIVAAARACGAGAEPAAGPADGAAARLSPQSGAPQPTTLRLSLDDAVRMGLENNLDLRVDRLDPQIADERVGQAKAAFIAVADGDLLAQQQPGAAQQLPGRQPGDADDGTDRVGGRGAAPAVVRQQLRRRVGHDEHQVEQHPHELQPGPDVALPGDVRPAAAEGPRDRRQPPAADPEQAQQGHLGRAVPRDRGPDAVRREEGVLGPGGGAGAGGRAAAVPRPVARPRAHQQGPRGRRPVAAARPGVGAGRSGPARGEPHDRAGHGPAGRGPAADAHLRSRQRRRSG